jgi:hypothetical protein
MDRSQFRTPFTIRYILRSARWVVFVVLCSSMLGCRPAQSDAGAFILGFSFVETFILPQLATEAPTFVDSFLGMFTSTVSTMNLGALPTLWTLTAPLYMLGGLLFGIATFRAGILPRWAGGLLVVGTALAPVAALLPLEHQPKVALPVGIALAWLGYALWAERREHAAQPVPGTASPLLRHTTAE